MGNEVILWNFVCAAARSFPKAAGFAGSVSTAPGRNRKCTASHCTAIKCLSENKTSKTGAVTRFSKPSNLDIVCVPSGGALARGLPAQAPALPTSSAMAAADVPARSSQYLINSLNQFPLADFILANYK